MSKQHGRWGAVYAGATTAVPVAETTGQGRQTTSDLAETTAQGATSKSYIPGISDYQLKVDLFYDDAFFILMDAAVNNTKLKIYDYPDRRNATTYFVFNGYVSMDSFDTQVGDVAKQSFTFVPDSGVALVHP